MLFLADGLLAVTIGLVAATTMPATRTASIAAMVAVGAYRTIGGLVACTGTIVIAEKGAMCLSDGDGDWFYLGRWEKFAVVDAAAADQLRSRIMGPAACRYPFRITKAVSRLRCGTRSRCRLRLLLRDGLSCSLSSPVLVVRRTQRPPGELDLSCSIIHTLRCCGRTQRTVVSEGRSDLRGDRDIQYLQQCRTQHHYYEALVRSEMWIPTTDPACFYCTDGLYTDRIHGLLTNWTEKA